MQVYVELWKARSQWLALSQQERSDYVDLIDEGIGKLCGDNVELVGIVLNDTEEYRRDEYRWLVIWKFSDRSFLRYRHELSERIGWDRYFERLDACGELLPSERVLVDIARPGSIGSSISGSSSGALWNASAGGWMMKLKRGLREIGGRAPKKERRDADLVPSNDPIVERQSVVVVGNRSEREPEMASASGPEILGNGSIYGRLFRRQPVARKESTTIDVGAYLKRIGYAGSLRPTPDTLRALHRSHLMTVPFENLDIHLGRAIILDEEALFEKIVRRRRGGFCYELNGLFASLLRELGFDVTLLSAGVARSSGGSGPEFDHLALLVKFQERWLADVGFGDSFIEPLRLDDPGEQLQQGSAYRITRSDGFRRLSRREGESMWHDLYRFTLLPHKLEDFNGMCDYHQTSPQSHFTRSRICSLATEEGRISLTDTQLIRTTGKERQEQSLSSAEEYDRMLRNHFGITIT
jgi:N-hydroxyarylamine O-acetyltransferase